MIFLNKASDLGHVRARHDLACFYYYGYSLPSSFQNWEKAVHLLELNAKESYVPSLTFLASMYKNGEGVPLNIARRKSLLDQAIENGYVPEPD